MNIILLWFEGMVNAQTQKIFYGCVALVHMLSWLAGYAGGGWGS